MSNFLIGQGYEHYEAAEIGCSIEIDERKRWTSMLHVILVAVVGKCKKMDLLLLLGTSIHSHHNSGGCICVVGRNCLFHADCMTMEASDNNEASLPNPNFEPPMRDYTMYAPVNFIIYCPDRLHAS